MARYEDVWKSLGTKVALDTPFIRVVEEQLQRDQGQPATYWIVERRNFTAVVPVWDDGTTLLVGEWRHGVKDYCVSFSMGYLEEGEEPIDGARRELLEETGYSGGEFHFLGTTVASPSYNGSKQYSFVVLNPAKTSETTDGEVEEFRRVSFEDVEKMILSGEIYDNNAISAFFLAKNFLKNKPK